MEKINLPPFYLGQQTVALQTVSYMNTGIVKDQVYVVKAMQQCKCGRWRIDIGLTVPVNGYQACGSCGFYMNEVSNKLYVIAELLAPITSTFQAITLEKVLENETSLISQN